LTAFAAMDMRREKGGGSKVSGKYTDICAPV